MEILKDRFLIPFFQKFYEVRFRQLMAKTYPGLILRLPENNGSIIITLYEILFDKHRQILIITILC